MRVLLVDDDRVARVPLRDDIREAGYEVDETGSAEEALDLLEKREYDVVVTDLRMPGMDGIELLELVKSRRPDAEVIVITAYGTVQTAVRAMKLGAYEYLTKPFDNEELLLILDRLRELRTVRAENIQLKRQLSDRYRFEHMIGKSPAMRKVFELIDTISASDSTVLIRGETGTGKEMVAHAIHAQSPRKDGPFVAVSCAALSKELLESELFGHEKGAFTSAIRDKVGKFQLADGGTIFLDEVDDIPLALQVKLLRVLQQHEFERVGGTETLRVDIRVIAATKVDLKQEVQQGRFREDLFYRLHVVPISLPPLRERREDIPLLIAHFLDLFSSSERRMTVSPEAMKVLLDYSWPGNVRELENLIERLVVIGTHPELRADDLPLEIRRPDLLADTQDRVAEPGVTQEILRRYRALEDLIQRSGILSSGQVKPVLGQVSFSEIVEATERDLIVRALDYTGANKTKAAELLGMKLSTFRDKLTKLGLDR
ncbi:MAG TPA: sigma-54-dependent Fis family transcriptional regulator [Candidatus Latescibacteria bacterium]|nr:sigma-54-dependent Fis family transcriptional regulator [Candidatus Latescibacterota bacterium]